MKIINQVFFLMLFAGNSILAQSYSPSDADSKVHFVIKNFGIKVSGDFTGLTGMIVFDPQAPGSANFNVSVKSASVDMDNTAMENHLRKAEYFNTAAFPQLTFVSTKVTNSTVTGRFYMYGIMTIKGVSKPVEFGFSATQIPSGYNFKGEFELNRRDFGVGSSSFSLADKLKVSLDVNALK